MEIKNQEGIKKCLQSLDPKNKQNLQINLQIDLAEIKVLITILLKMLVWFQTKTWIIVLQVQIQLKADSTILINIIDSYQIITIQIMPNKQVIYLFSKTILLCLLALIQLLQQKHSIIWVNLPLLIMFKTKDQVVLEIKEYLQLLVEEV